MITSAFLGTPEAALPTMRRLATDTDLRLVVTRPDRPRGRSGRPVPGAVKRAAGELGIPVAQPATAAEVAGALGGAGPIDVAVVVAYGMVLRPEALGVPRRGVLNVHFSLLPRWRGAAPVARALLAGDERTGVSVMVLDEGLDTGPVVATASLAVAPGENAGMLTERLAGEGARLLAGVLPAYVEGLVPAVAQPTEGVTWAPRLEPADRVLRLDEPPEAFVRRVRALAPRPGARASREGAVFKVLEARPSRGGGAPGELRLEDGRLVCPVSGGAVELVRVQPAGGRVMSGGEWARGRRGALGRLE